MTPTMFVTFPRSGHHLTVRLLARYFSRKLDVLQSGYELPGFLVAGPFVWCEHYRHCGRVGCTDPRTVAQKNHDFDLNLVLPDGWLAVVQYRNPIPAIVSHYRLLLKQGDARESRLAWRWRLRRDLRYYRHFVEKWVIGREAKDTFWLEYGELMSRPVERLDALVRFLGGEADVDEAWVSRVVEAEKVRPRSHLRDFPYYDQKALRSALKSLFPRRHPARSRLPIEAWIQEI